MSATSDTVTAAEIIRNFGYWQQQALMRPLTITHHGRARVLLVSVDQFEQLHHSGGDPFAAAPTKQDVSRISPILENMAEGFLTCDANLNLREMNKVAEAYFGKTRADAVGRSLNEFFSSPSDEFVVEGFRRALRTGEILTYETSSIFFPGRRISARIFPYQDGVAALFVNISEMERLRASAEDWEAMSSALTQAASSSWIKLDARGRIMKAGDGFVRATGFSADGLNGVRVADILGGPDRRRLQTAFEDVLTSRRPANLDVTIIVKDGRERAVHLAIAPLVRDCAAQGAMVLVSMAESEPAAVPAPPRAA